MSGAPPPLPPNIEEIAAPLLLGGIWNWSLFGALVVQFYVYSYNFPGDKRFIKLLGMDNSSPRATALSGADLYHWFVTGFGNIDRLTTPYASAFDVPIMGSVVSLSVQFFFAYRIWVLGKKESWWLCALICLFSIVDATAAFIGGTYTHVHGKFASGRVLKVLAMTWLIGNTVSDLLIAAAMLYHLAKRKARDGHFSSHALVSIVRLTIETNMLTTAVGIISLLMVVIYPVSDSRALCTSARHILIEALDANAGKELVRVPHVGAREAVRAISALSPPPHHAMRGLTLDPVLTDRYSNTLLVSLNNRISIRDTSVAHRGAVRSPAGMCPTSSTARSEATTDIVLMDIDKSPEAFKVRTLEAFDSRERIISEFTRPPIFSPSRSRSD
ncbi:hypothetical protein BC826DRAFT_1108468 [Russula brevipes]|nr:hypothetical protein BC826DRAFT_1108468 [Russula brevipes]